MMQGGAGLSESEISGGKKRKRLDFFFFLSKCVSHVPKRVAFLNIATSSTQVLAGHEMASTSSMFSCVRVCVRVCKCVQVCLCMCVFV